MFSKLYLVLALALGAALQVHGHALITPALGVTGAGARSDVQRPSKAAECGNVNVANTINTSTPVVANADGSFTATITNFNAGKDGSRQVTALVDASGTGKSFVAATVTQNGDLAPTDVGSQQLTVSLPAGTKCTGGTSGDLCLASFTTAGGFGNCVVVQQGGAASGAAAAGGAAAAPASAASTAQAAGASASAAAGGKKKHHKGANAAAAGGAAAGQGQAKAQLAKAQQAKAAAQQANVQSAKVKGPFPRIYGSRLARSIRHGAENWM